MFCPECGTKIEDATALFCVECGTPLERDDAPLLEEETAKSNVLAHGILLTNTLLLAQKFGADEEEVKDLLEQYIACKKQVGISYSLVDLQDFGARSSKFFSFSSSKTILS